MKKFTFKLAPVLNYRSYLEKLAQQETANAHMNVQNSENQIQELNDTRFQNTRNMDTAVSKGIKASVFTQYALYNRALEAGIKEEQMRKAQLEKILKEKLIALKKKSVDKKVMELYRDKLKDEYQLGLAKEEQKVQDENTSLKIARTLSDETA